MRYPIFHKLLFLLIFSVTPIIEAKPFSGAVLVKEYTPQEFQSAIYTEKRSWIKVLEEYMSKEDSYLTPFMSRNFPTLSEWIDLKEKIKEEDRILEYRHKDYPGDYDGAAEIGKLVFLVKRGKKTIKRFNIDSAIYNYEI